MSRIVNAILSKFGFRLVRTRKTHGEPKVGPCGEIHARLDRFLKQLTDTPLNPEIHLAYATEAARCNRPYLAYAELKSAEFLGADQAGLEECKPGIQNSLPDVMAMNHNQYFRFSSLATEIRARVSEDNMSVLDVGGGQGELASFLPNARYCLAEPLVNGISGTDLPFSDHSFDLVIACHVLEHIPVEAREEFLDQLLTKSKLGVILLNPFHIEETHVEERLKLFYEITGAQWAREHLECSLPRLELIESYAEKNGLHFEVKPNGTLTTSMALVFMDYFAGLARQHSKWSRINEFFNANYTPIMDSCDYPNSYMLYLTRDARNCPPLRARLRKRLSGSK